MLRVESVEHQALVRSRFKRDEPMSHAGMRQQSMAAGDSLACLDCHEHKPEDLVDPGRLEPHQIDPLTSAWRDAQVLVPQLMSEVQEQMRTPESEMRLQNVRTTLADAYRKIGIPVPSDATPALIDSLAYTSRYMDDNKPPTPESILAFITDSKALQGKSWASMVEPSREFLNPVTNQTDAAKLHAACLAFTDKFGPSYNPNTHDADNVEQSNEWTRIWQAADRLPTSSHVPLS